MQTYHIWTIGCQMNTADSERLGSALEQLGLVPVERPADADVVVLNSCVVRQSAEDKVVGTLNLNQPLRKKRPDAVLALTGCMVGPKTGELERRFPHVDLFLRPQQFEPLLELVGQRLGLDWEGCVGSLAPQQPDVTTYVPIIHGCDLMCSFCIIPYRRGRQVSRSVDDIAHEVQLLATRGVREVTVLGQTVDAYGHDRDDGHDLADLLTRLNDVDDLDRIRFLTSHPSYMSSRIIKSVAALPKVCEHINLPVQAGDDDVLLRMRRPYTVAEYRDIVSEIRDTVPDVTISTDIIVGFPGETEAQFQNTCNSSMTCALIKFMVRPTPPGPAPSPTARWRTTFLRTTSGAGSRSWKPSRRAYSPASTPATWARRSRFWQRTANAAVGPAARAATN